MTNVPPREQQGSQQGSEPNVCRQHTLAPHDFVDQAEHERHQQEVADRVTGFHHGLP
jgi:hypothetical protein